MKIYGEKLTVNEEVVVFPRKNGKDIVVIARAVLSYTDFEKLCPEPQAKIKTDPRGISTPMIDHPDYVKALSQWQSRRTDFMILRSLEATPGLEWDTVKISEPDTWGNYRSELEDSGLSVVEIGRVYDAVLTACGLNDKKIDEATQSFLAGQGGSPNGQSSHHIEQANTQSGELVNVLESDRLV